MQPAGLWINRDGSARAAAIKGGPLYEAFYDFRRAEEDQLSSTPGDLARAYASAVWAYRCIKLRADSVAGVPLTLLDREGAPIEHHPVLDLLRDVNPFTMNLGDLLRATEAAYNIWGVAYWLKIAGAGNGGGNGNGRAIKWLAWLNPQTVEPMVDSQRGVTGYKQTVGGQTRLFAPEEVIAFRNFNPLDDLGGLSPLAVALREVNAELNASRFVASFFANDARPAGLLSTEQMLPEGEIERVRTWWEQLFKGTGNKWKTGVVGGGLRWQSITFPMTDLALSNLRGEDRRAICAAFGVPAALAGAWEAATYASAREQKASFYEDTIIPQLNYVAEVLNWSLLPHYPDLTARDAKLSWDLDSLTALRESAEEKARRFAMLFKAGIVTRQEARTALGLGADFAPDEEIDPEDDDPLPPAASAAANRGGKDTSEDVSADGAKAFVPMIVGADRDPPLPNEQKQRALDDLRRWRRFAINRMKVGRKLRAFKSAPIPADIYLEVSSGIGRARTVEEIRRIFSAAIEKAQAGSGLSAANPPRPQADARRRTGMSAGSGPVKMLRPAAMPLRGPVI